MTDGASVPGPLTVAGKLVSSLRACTGVFARVRIASTRQTQNNNMYDTNHIRINSKLY